MRYIFILLAVVAFLAMVPLHLTISGVCYPEHRYLGSAELVERVAEKQGRDKKECWMGNDDFRWGDPNEWKEAFAFNRYYQVECAYPMPPVSSRDTPEMPRITASQSPITHYDLPVDVDVPYDHTVLVTDTCGQPVNGARIAASEEKYVIFQEKIKSFWDRVEK